MASPTNDNFANAEQLVGVVGSIETFNGPTATSDGANDPLVALFHTYGSQSVWYKYAGNPGPLTVFTSLSPFGVGGTGSPLGSGSILLTRPVIGIYRGSALGALTELGFDDGTTVTKKNYNNVTAKSSVSVTLPAVETYYIEVTGFNDSGGGGSNVTKGQFRLLWDGTYPSTVVDPVISLNKRL